MRDTLICKQWTCSQTSTNTFLSFQNNRQFRRTSGHSDRESGLGLAGHVSPNQTAGANWALKVYISVCINLPLTGNLPKIIFPALLRAYALAIPLKYRLYLWPLSIKLTPPVRAGPQVFDFPWPWSVTIGRTSQSVKCFSISARNDYSSFDYNNPHRK